MSSTINVYAVSVDRLKQVIGSANQALAEQIAAENDSFLTSIDEIDADADLTCAAALSELIAGDANDDAPGYLYAYAFEAMCASLGEALPNIGSIARASAWIVKVDDLLKAQGIPLRLSDLVDRGAPVPFPEPSEYPYIGRWNPGEIAAALASFQSQNIANLTDERDTFEQLQSWLESATKKPETSLIGFLSYSLLDHPMLEASIVMRNGQLAPENQLRAYSELLHRVFYLVRACSMGEHRIPDEQLFDLMDAVHNVPCLLVDNQNTNDQMIREYFLRPYDNKWAGKGEFTFSLIAMLDDAILLQGLTGKP